MRKSFWVICVDNHEYPASLERGKVYRAFADADAEEMVRIVDETGEGYLFPLQYFERIALPARVQQELRRPAALYRRPTRNSAALRK
ncbi:MAG: hypothetical protein V1790_14530 [Planctomycetota bacterium]